MAVKTLSNGIHLKNKRLAIITNGGGPGVMATDRAAELGIELPQPTPQTFEKLNAALPKHWSHGNPIDVLGDASSERYLSAVEACQNDPQFDAILVMLTPQAMTHPLAVAHALADFVQNTPHCKPIFTAWLGESLVAKARTYFSAHKIPTFHTPEAAVEAFAFLSDYHQNQQLLMQVPATGEQPCIPADVEGARTLIQAALGEQRAFLSSTETRAVLHAFGLPITPAIEATNAQQAMVAAESLGFPVSIKINSPSLTHKSDVGGVRLNLNSVQEVRQAFSQMVGHIQQAQPDTKILGVTVEPMYHAPFARELLVGVARDPIFGPAITFGSGGTDVEVLQDRSIALPPLNEFIARRVIATTEDANQQTIEIAVTRYTTNPDGVSCEMAIVVRDDYQHQGVAALLLQSLISHAKSKGLKRMEGEVLSENVEMLRLARSFGFKLAPLEDDPQITAISLPLVPSHPG